MKVALLGAALSVASTLVQATVITGSSDGSFANISGCSGANTCRIANGVDGANTVLEWGYGSSGPGSTLVAKDRAWSVGSTVNDLVLAELVWTNRATLSSITPDILGVKYTLDINFSKPNAASDSEPFSFAIVNTTNPSGDYLLGLTLADLSGLSFALNGIEMSNMKYQLAAGSAGTFNGSYWSNPENMVSRMTITADFKPVAVKPVDNSQTAKVPEPASIALLASGLFGIGFLRRRKGA